MTGVKLLSNEAKGRRRLKPLRRAGLWLPGKHTRALELLGRRSAQMKVDESR